MVKTVKRSTPEKATPHCPFCDAEIMAMNLPVCQACHIAIIYCLECKKPLPKNVKTCPKCGTKVKK